MKKLNHAFSIQLFVLFFALMVPAISAQTFEVTRTDDPVPDGCNSGTDCSLREAIIAANDVASGIATIQLQGGQTYTLSIVNPTPEDDFDSPDETTGSLKILNTDANIRIEATGSGMATIDADDIDRVFIIYAGTDVEIDEIEITGGNPENGRGGGIFAFNNNDLEITNSSITGNTAIDINHASGFGYGGGIWAEGVTMTITGSTISNNEAGFQGGGLRIIRYNEEVTVNSDVTIQNSTITNNDGGQYAGGIFTERSDLTIIETTISENQSTFFGGGVHISIDGNVTIDRSAIINNDNFNDEGNGGLSGGLDIGGGEVLIINSTISGNEAGNFNGAGGIYVGNFSDPVVDIVNTTITNNRAGSIGGIKNGTGGGVINFSNSIVANQAEGDDCSGTLNSNGHNIESAEDCGLTETGDLQNSDPLLGPLLDNGGPVFTHAITGPLSPAVNNGSNTLYTDAGGNLATDSDANGNDRVYNFGSGGIIDIGAFELQQDATVEGCPVTHEDNILFVKKGDSGTGANWFDALGELRDALALFEDETCTTEDVEEIWVTAGTYLPTDDSGDREATFLMPGVNIYGGFEGVETNKNQRDLDFNISILSAHINNDGDDLAGNSYHVVTSMHESSGVLFDFTITGGNANGSDPYDKGGGLYASNGGISMSNVLFENNYAETAGGGAYVIETVERIGAQHPAFFRTTFRNNESGADGGGLALEEAESRITLVIFENNSAGQNGGGLFNDESNPIIKNTIFRENSAQQEGGGILNERSSPELYNVLIADNEARVNGGGLVNAINANPILTNVTISGNQAELVNGGGIYNRNVAAPVLLNTIVWGNTAIAGTGNEIWNSSNSTIELNFSLYGNETGDIVEGDGFTVTNSLTSDPVFSNTGSQDFTLQYTSPAINTGDPGTDLSDFRVLTSNAIDLAENPRVYNGDVDIIDMGAYEFQGNPVPPSSCPATNSILYVKKGESGTGSAWDDALGELRDIYALFDSEDCTTEDVHEIWVAAGTYLPTDSNSERTASFSIIDGVDWYGGFEGVSSETSTEGRDWETHVTILSGHIDDDEALDGNSYHVVTVAENASGTILDGFTITGGNADLVDANDNSVGGGLYVNNGMLAVRNTLFDNNFAQISGGGVYIKDSGEQPVFTNVQFMNNESNLGGGLASENSSPRISASVFSENTANWGGGARLLGGSPLIDQAVFTGNTGNTSGGGLSLRAGTVAKSVQIASDEPDHDGLITNSVFSGNEVLGENGGGAGIIIEESNVTLRNILASGNSSDGFGGGIQFMDAPLSLIINSTVTGNQSQKFGGGVQIINSSPTVQNSIVWNNDSIDHDFERADNFSKGVGDPVISYSLIEGCNPAGAWDEFCGTDGGNNLSDIAPLFDTGISPGDAPATDGDFSLTSASPVINFGNNTLYTDSGGDINNDLDLAEEPRLFDGTTDVIDLGAYEFQGEPDGSEPGFAPFITTWEVEAGDLQITIPTAAGQTYSYDVDWGDGESDTGQTGDAIHTYDSASTYTVKITGTFPQIEFGNTGDKDKIMSVEQWGDIEWGSMRKAFQGATNLVINATDTPDLSNATSLLEMFSGATSVNGGLENWDVSTITSMFGVFDGATSFNGDISGWTVTAATDMIRMFAGAASFNRDISGWDVDNVTTMESMFDGATSFNQDLSTWNTGNVSGMSRMFHDATAFNQDLGGWDIADVSSMTEMLDGSGLSTENYDNTLIGWESQSVQDGVSLGADGLTYCNGETARQSLIDDDNWTITGDALVGGCDSVEGEDQRILAGNLPGQLFSGSDFGIANEAFSVKIETLPDEGELRFEGSPVAAGDEISVADLNDDKLVWNPTPDSDEYGYNFTSFDFKVVDDGDTESEESYTMTIDVGAAFVELTGGEGWRFLTNPSMGDTYGGFLDPLWTKGVPGSDNPGSPLSNLYMLNQEEYEWEKLPGLANDVTRGQAFLVYAYSDDDNNGSDDGFPKTLTSGQNWEPFDNEFSYSGLGYDTDQGSEGDSHYLVGNPHPIALDFCGFTSANVASSLDVWDPSANGGNGDYVNLSCAAGDVFIAPFQSFWIRTIDTNPSLDIPEKAYLETAEEGYFKEKDLPGFENLAGLTLRIESIDGVFTNLTRILFSKEASVGLDEWDAPKLSPAGLASRWLSFYSLDANNKAYALQSLPLEVEEKVSIPLDIQTTEAGRFTLDWSLPPLRQGFREQASEALAQEGYFLRDNRTGEVMELREGSSYGFEIAPNQTSKVSKTLEVSGTATSQPSHRWERSDGFEPRFELLVAVAGVDGFTELGAVPEEFELSQNYPNPFNPSTVISYQLPVNSEVHLAVYDLLGRRVAELVNGKVAAGRHTVNFDASGLSSGVYLYRLQAGSSIMTKKLTVVK